MSRITGTDAFDMMEAYNAVYASQEEVELTEEQIQEDFENWVNSLVEEGHDLSEYTWEDMYEEYLNEMGQPGGNRPGQQSTTRGAITTYAQPRVNTGQPYQSRFARPMNAGTPRQTGTGIYDAPGMNVVSRPQIGSLPSNYRGQELQAGARARASQVGTPRQGSAGTGAAPSAAARSVARPASAAPTARPAAPAQRPSTPARPVVSAPASARPTSTATTGFQLARQGVDLSKASAPSAPAAPRSSLAQQTAELRKMRQASQQRQIAQGGTPATPLVQSFDPFDIVMGYLIDEGYAENEEAATVIMANMSEEWRQSIVEYSDLSGFKPRAFPNMKQYPAVLGGNKGMVSGEPGTSGRAFRKDPKDYNAAVSTIERNTGRKLK